MSGIVTEHHFIASKSSGEVSALLTLPEEATSLYVFGHGAGAGMRHQFMDAASQRLARNGVATFRYNFPYMEAGRKVPNPAPILLKTVRSAVAAAVAFEPGLPLVAGGKSMGGRMTSHAAAAQALEGVLGLAFFGFPLHAPGRDSDQRGMHLGDVRLPMLFLQGTRDKLANLDILTPLLQAVEPQPTLHVVDGADHGFHMLKRSGRSDDEVMDEMCDLLATWVSALT